MALHVDMTRAFRTPAERELLVRAVLSAKPEDEAHWIEWKCPPRLTTAEFTSKIAKSILGFANRSPAVAATVAEGTAYLVLGAGAKGVCPGVEVIDAATLGQSLAPYLGGADGPRWSPNYVEVASKAVLIVTVEAPVWGDRIYALRKAYERFHAGMIFHRGISQTEPASPGDIRMLEERLLQGQRDPGMDIEVVTSVSSPGLCRLDTSEAAVEEWLRRRHEALDDLLPTAPARSGKSLFGSNFDNLTAFGAIDRTTFRREVADHLKTCQARLPLAAEAALESSGLNKLFVRVRNATDVTVADVELRLVLDAKSLRVPNDEDEDYELPQPPKPGAGYGLDVSRLASLYSVRPRTYKIGGPVCEIDDGKLVIIYRAGDVRPGREVRCETVTLIVDAVDGAEQTGTWSATSTSRIGQARGPSPCRWQMSCCRSPSLAILPRLRHSPADELRAGMRANPTERPSPP